MRFIYLSVLCLVVVMMGCRRLPESAEIVPPLYTQAVSQSAETTLQLLSSTNPPPRDLMALAERYKGVEPQPVTPRNEKVGDVVLFWYKEGGENNQQKEAELRYQSAELNLWIEKGARINESDLKKAAEKLENEIIPTSRRYFGAEPPQSTDGDTRINILHLKNIGGIGAETVAVGYFSKADEYPQTVNPYSNERKMFYISLREAPLASDVYYKTIAHEFQHMIHAHTDGNELAWVDEGLAEFSNYVNGYPDVDSVTHFAQLPDVQLNDWKQGSEEDLAHYGASFLFSAYFHHRFGDTALQEVIRNEANGFAGFASVIREQTGTEFFADWVIANYLGGLGRTMAIYDYGEGIALEEMAVSADYRTFPVTATASVYQFGTDYVRVRHKEPLTLSFTGSTELSYLPTEPHRGNYFVSTIPADRSAMALTRAFDLRDVSAESAKLSFWTWYQIEKGWDYGYIAVSADQGATWQLQPNLYATTANPQGNNYGVGLTGKSGLAVEPTWAEITLDLAPFVGKEVLVRWEYVTDDAVNEAGWAIDDLSFPALNYYEGFEEESADWQKEGWVRHTNRLPQQYIVQAIYIGASDVSVERLTLDAQQTGTWTLSLSADYPEVILAISASTPITSQRAPYQYELRP